MNVCNQIIAKAMKKTKIFNWLLFFNSMCNNIKELSVLHNYLKVMVYIHGYILIFN